MKGKLKVIIAFMILIILIIEFIKVTRLFELSGVCNISADAWLDFFGNILQILITIVGFAITICIFIKEREEKEKPFIIIKPAKEKDCNYVCNTENMDFTQHRKVYFELVNKGNVIIKNPRIKDNRNRLNNLYKNGTESELDIIEPEIMQTNNKYIICIDMNYMEGMCEFISNTFELQYRNYKDKKYKCTFEIEMARHNGEYVKIFIKDQDV